MPQLPQRPNARRSRGSRTRRPKGVPTSTLIASVSLAAGLLGLVFFAQSLLARVGSAEEATASPGSALARPSPGPCASLWSERAPALEDGLAPPAPSEKAIQTCLAEAKAAASLASKIPSTWRAMRSAHYLSAFTSAADSEKVSALENAATLADQSLEDLAAALGESELLKWKGAELATRLERKGFDPDDVARLHFWTAIVWGAKGQSAGLLAIVRDGVANRMHDNARIAVRLDPSIDRGGAYRLLSRLNADLPRVPFISGWVDREKALPQAKKALAQGPTEPGNQLILALALLDQEEKSGSEIRALLRSATSAAPRPSLRAEDWAVQKQAQEVLDAL
ncbi:MAG: hypothetical protein AB8G23_13215 [Myxococcota bacterium]